MVTAALPHVLPNLLNPARLDRGDTRVAHEPFDFLVAYEQLPRQHATALARDFPRYAGAGFFPYDQADCGPAINALVEQLLSLPFANAIGARLGVDVLAQYPALVTLCRTLNSRHGNVHTDSTSKVVTALVYLMDSWPEERGGNLRLLRAQDDIESTIVPEIKPLYGTIVAFRRSDRSFHGHLPYEGERRVIQVAWLTSEAEKLRKTRRGRLSRVVKWLAGALDRRWRRRGPD